jgi:tetratricopeptide (TPR) repeat protein
MIPSPGSKLGPFEIHSPVGSGGMGEVFRAKDTNLGRQVAIKVLHAHLATNAEARERLRREAQAAASLDHPFICKVFEIGEADGALFLAMEFLSGETLFERLRAGSLPLTEALRIAREIGEALEDAHRNRIVHRDLKPTNVMLTQGHVKVMDFGLARHFDGALTGDATNNSATTMAATPALTQRGALIGTPEYMSPEQVRGDLLDQRSDLFSFGILLNELLGGTNPFRRGSATETMAAILRDPPNLASDLPQGLMILVRRLLAKELDQRYQSMSDVLADLERLTVESLAPRAEPAATSIPLIGREQEFAELKRALAEALAGRGSIVMIGGEPGIGKTHLAGAILEEARWRGVFACIGHCYEGEGAPPYIPFIEILEQIVRTAPRASLRLGLGDDAPEIAKIVPELRKIYPDMPLAIQLPPEQQRRYMFNAYRSWLERSAQVTPGVVVFEDLHWADEPTLLLLQHIAQTLSSMAMLVMCTYRDVELEVTRPFAKTLETLLRQKQAVRISLRRLSASGVEDMLAAMSGQKPPQSLARVIFKETEGNPFFVEEVFRYLAEEGKLFDGTGKWLPGLRVDELQVPEGVRLVLGRRLGRLGEDTRRVLTTAAVIGRSFSLRLLEELENDHPDAVLNAVEEAERAHLVMAESGGRDPRYSFVHELVRHTLSESLSLPRRQRIHARVGDAIERVFAANLEVHASQLAHHLYQAGAAADAEKTTKYLVLAARQARDAAGHEDAVVHLDNALSLWEGEASSRVGELWEQRAGALRSMGELDEAVASYQKAIGLFEAAGATQRLAQASLQLGWLQSWRIDLEGVRLTLERALKHLDGVDLPLKGALLGLNLVRLSGIGNPLEGTRELEKLKALCADNGVPFAGPASRMEIHHLWVSAQLGKILDGYQRVAAECRAMGDRWGESDVEYTWLGAETYCGRPQDAARDLPGAIVRAEKIGHHGSHWALKLFGAFLAKARGDLAGAEREAIETWEFGQEHGVSWNFVTPMVRAGHAFMRGDLVEAERLCSDRPELERISYFSGTIESTLFSILAGARDERAEAAWKNRQWKLPIQGQPNTKGAWIALAHSVMGLASMGRREEVAALRPLTEELLLTGAWCYLSLAPHRSVAGIAAACAGDWAAAEEHHLTAIRQMDAAPYKHLQPAAREWYAAMLLERNGAGDAGKGRALLQEAVMIYEATGMTYPAKRASEKIAAL